MFGTSELDMTRFVVVGLSLIQRRVDVFLIRVILRSIPEPEASYDGGWISDKCTFSCPGQWSRLLTGILVMAMEGEVMVCKAFAAGDGCDQCLVAGNRFLGEAADGRQGYLHPTSR